MGAQAGCRCPTGRWQPPCSSQPGCLRQARGAAASGARTDAALERVRAASEATLQRPRVRRGGAATRHARTADGGWAGLGGRLALKQRAARRRGQRLRAATQQRMQPRSRQRTARRGARTGQAASSHPGAPGGEPEARARQPTGRAAVQQATVPRRRTSAPPDTARRAHSSATRAMTPRPASPFPRRCASAASYGPGKASPNGAGRRAHCAATEAQQRSDARRYIICGCASEAAACVAASGDAYAAGRSAAPTAAPATLHQARL